MGKIKNVSGTVFPTPVGMNRAGFGWLGAQRSVPHARGDEPPLGPPPQIFSTVCSPRPWG